MVYPDKSEVGFYNNKRGDCEMVHREIDVLLNMMLIVSEVLN
jgi:hypothetical protein